LHAQYTGSTLHFDRRQPAGEQNMEVYRMAVIGGRNVGTNDLAIMISGVVMFIVSFLPWYGVSFHGVAGISGGSASVSGWHFVGAWFPVLLVIAVAGFVAARVFGNVALPSIANGAVGWGFVTAAVSLIAAIIILLRWLTYPSAGVTGFSAGAKFGTYLGLIVAIVQTVFGYLNIVHAGERLPWQKRTA
jgi:hypothetical protein